MEWSSILRAEGRRECARLGNTLPPSFPVLARPLPPQHGKQPPTAPFRPTSLYQLLSFSGPRQATEKGGLLTNTAYTLTIGSGGGFISTVTTPNAMGVVPCFQSSLRCGPPQHLSVGTSSHISSPTSL
ncbi:hypothetical protein DPEC_G00101030 [Dallia pectoralis]|uniref:Uncharacterized protein n=1 Tax=Dallia pectoralis TaxID=75939 RepID=A0ACC2GXM1_DALPE|nr:hypothetical protein DPEC_G00101030 [Dallia pectoralis]